MIEMQPNDAIRLRDKESWKIAEADSPIGYRCEIRLRGNAQKGYVGYVAQLGSAVSQGDDLESAIKNVIEAFRGCVETYRAEQMEIPWTDPKESKASFDEAVLRGWDDGSRCEDLSYWAVVNA
ncbi:MAG TPA: type II toxin-antitoxin system HicB family antitoxin [Phycisphaerae bacterium]|nr:type II toxin-antitoxin system HicB family antitoxin [Phycisphaerales bacterium]HRX84030.1 type II toxin-antitoxin system HicB family antitoxin [Phycisphaerae bacterium]